ncbi:hypothetical protein [Bacillus sp. 1NLA3E]|uniref:hypothetical protein n=1 Tax=Bacillus sp. 1NLA3E TaxID=666686 RepID=UPI000247EA44|nr:hypothetical protein [Bacillus sp. 1NLA3E]AGK52138.1 hypothetical protein B1NLA3E_01770 [Bacillus sp. 1NLA3E]
MAEKHNLIINGSGSYGGGFFNKIKIRGEGTITSDFECEAFKTYGTSSILKNGTAGKFDVYGEVEILGNLVVDEMKIFGTAAVGGTGAIRKTKVWGTLDLGNRFSGEEVDIKGSLSVKGDAEFEIFQSTGAFEISGLLNAGIVKLNPRFGTSNADEIGGEKIIVKRKLGFFPFFTGDGSLEARVIEGDEIFLENTRAEVVRGNRVHIGVGCEIGLVEYKEEFTADANARVKQHRKVG